jgi:hypothetical protein
MMTATKNGTKLKQIDSMLRETSSRIMKAMALSASEETREAEAEWLRAAVCEEEVAYWLETEGQDIEAAIHYVSAGSCYARVRDYSRAVPFLRAALSFSSLREAFRRDIQKLLKEWLPKAKKQLRLARKRRAPVA